MQVSWDSCDCYKTKGILFVLIFSECGQYIVRSESKLYRIPPEILDYTSSVGANDVSSSGSCQSLQSCLPALGATSTRSARDLAVVVKCDGSVERIRITHTTSKIMVERQASDQVERLEITILPR